MTFSADTLEGFLVVGSLAGLGLVIAIYSWAMPIVTSCLERRVKKLKSLTKRRDEVFDKMKRKKEDTELTASYQTLQSQIKQTKKLPFHLDTGYAISGISFAVVLIINLLKIMFPLNEYISKLATLSLFVFAMGIVSFMIVWIFLFIEFRTYATEEFQKVKEESEKKEEEEEKILRLRVRKS